ncbi:hypothetical protein HYX07_05450 [Candidatus Woesearchaeota archaeon]|nr:hypothetical protein [Candidatus Woesearchaeota archaeon]
MDEMGRLIEKWIINSSLPALLIVLILGLFTEPDLTGFVTSDGSYISPTSDNSYKSPTSDESYKSPVSDKDYESPTTGPGYIAPKIDESWEAPKEGPGLLRPEVGPGFEEPLIGPGFERIGVYNVSFNESGEKIIKIILDMPETNISDKKKDEIKNDPKKPKVVPKGPIDEASVGGWKVYGITHYYKNGGSKFIPATIAQMNLHDDGTYDYRGYEGTWESAQIADDDWKKWGIKNENFNKKLIFHNWPDGGGGTATGPIEDTSYGARYLWAVFDAEPPESAEPAQAWIRFVAAPYNPKAQDGEFSELSLIGKWGIHFIPLRLNEKGKWVQKFDTTTILELKSDKTWAFGTSQGTWKVFPIEEEDWIKWRVNPYGPKKKIVLEGFGDDGGSGPIEAYKGEVSFFWAMYKATNPETGKQQPFQKKFRPYENPVAYLTAEVEGSGQISSDDSKLSCAVKEREAAQGGRGKKFVEDAG